MGKLEMMEEIASGRGKALDLPACRRLVAQLPITLRPSLNQQLSQWEMLFPFERKSILAFLEGMDSLNPAELQSLTANLRSLEKKMGIEQWHMSDASETMENDGKLARSQYFAEWRHEVQELFKAVDAKGAGAAEKEPEVRRLILLFLPRELPVDAGSDGWRELGMMGREVRIAGDAGEFRRLVCGDSLEKRGLGSLLAARENHDDADLWFIDAEDVLKGSSPRPAAAISCSLSYADLKPFRDRFLMELNTIPRDLTAADQTIAELRRTDWTPYWPADLTGQQRLLNFMVSLFVSGNGALIFSNAFVQWAASEAIRRARPQALVASFGLRNKPKPFSGIAIFENQEKVSPLPDVPDPENSAVDAVILARYIFLAARRYREYDRALCLCVSESLNTAYVMAPPEMKFRFDSDPLAPDELYQSIASWLIS